MSEKIIRFRRAGVQIAGSGNETVPCRAIHEVIVPLQGGQEQIAARLENAISDSVFEVYTVPEIDSANQGLEQRVSATVEQRITDAKANLETSLREQVVASVDAIPQRLLTEEAIKILKEAVLNEIRNELTAIKQDLESQIDEIKT